MPWPGRTAPRRWPPTLLPWPRYYAVGAVRGTSFTTCPGCQCAQRLPAARRPVDQGGAARAAVRPSQRALFQYRNRSKTGTCGEIKIEELICAGFDKTGIDGGRGKFAVVENQLDVDLRSSPLSIDPYRFPSPWQSPQLFAQLDSAWLSPCPSLPT